MGLISSTPGKTSETSSSTSTFTPDPGRMAQWNEALNTAGGLRDNYMNAPPPQQDVAAPGDLSNKYWQNAQNQQPFDTSYYHQPMRETYGEMSGARIDPTGINFKQDYSFAPGALNFNDPYAKGVPQVGPGGGLGATAADYNIPWERVAAQQVAGRDISAPGSIERISGLERVSAPELQYYQMGPAERVQAQQVKDFQMAQAMQVASPELKQYMMQAAQNVAPGGLASTKSWTDPGVAEQYMNPYQQQVAAVQKKRATEDWQMQNQMLGAEAAKAGAFGGSRHGVRESQATRDAMDQMAAIEASGLQQAYQQGMGQFTGEQQMGLAAQQFNLGQGMQAALANQAAQQQAAQMNLQSQLQTQGLGAQMGMQAQLANQAAGLQVGQNNLGALMQAEALRTGYGMQSQLANQAANLQVGQANLGANLQTQGLGANLNMQGQLANQQQTYQQALANQMATKFEREQQMQASMANQANAMEAARANQTAMLQAGMANQQTGYGAGLAAAQMGQQGQIFNAQQAMQAGLANQGAGMQMLGDQYKGGLAAGMQGQQLGFQGQVRGAEMNQQSQFQLEQAKQNAMNFNLNALGQQGQMATNMGNLGLSGFNANLNAQQLAGQAAQNQQNYYQLQQDTQFANNMRNYQMPMATMDWYSKMLGQAPMAYTQSGTSQSQGTQTAPQQPWLQTILGGAMAAAGTFAGMKKGGYVKTPSGKYRSGGPVKKFGQRPFVPPGLLTPGNIDLHARLVVRNADGSISTVRSASFGDKGREVLVPTVSDDGRVLSDKDAWQQYLDTGRHLGMFKTPKHATSYAERLHKEQEKEYVPRFADGGLGALSSELEPQFELPGWMQRAKKKLTDPIGTTPYTGGPMISWEDFVPTKESAAIDIGLAALPPGGKLAGKALKLAGKTKPGQLVNALGKTVRGTLVGKGKKYIPFAEDIQALAAKLNPAEPAAAMKEAQDTLKWKNWDQPATVKSSGELRPTKATAPKRRRLQNTQDAIEERVGRAEAMLRQPTEPWRKVDYGIFDRRLIDEAMEGFPGVKQTEFPRRVPKRADTGYVEELYQDPRNRDLIKRQIERGLPLGGETFYPSLYPVKAAVQEAGGLGSTYDNWVSAVAPGSARNSIYNERAVGNFLLDMHHRGLALSPENVKKEMALFKRKYGRGLPLMPVHRQGTVKALEGALPRDILMRDATDSYKIPTYSVNQQGDFARSWTGDVHEAAGETLASRMHPYFKGQGGFGVNEYGPAERGMRGIADEMGLPTGTAQAGRWFGGGEMTGLLSPRGDSLDMLERQAAYTMHELGLPTDPKSVRKYILGLTEKGGIMLPWQKKSAMPEYRMFAPGSQSR